MRRGVWSSRYAFYLATLGSAFSLGNLWRFPYVVGTNGGGAFVILYVFCVLAIGLPLAIAELSLGKANRLSVLGAINKVITEGTDSKRFLNNKKWLWFGRLAILCSLLLLAYYAVICGWVLYFVMQYLFAFFGREISSAPVMFNTLMQNGWLQVGLTSVHLLITFIVVAKGLRQGIEKWLIRIMPIFVILMIVLIVKSLSLSGTPEAIRYLFYPDFSKVKFNTLINVIGHVLFTLSLGMGTMVVFGSYLKEEMHVLKSGFRVVMLDTVVSIFVGLLIFPIVFTMSTPTTTGPSLLFYSLPQIFNEFHWGTPFGVVFFLCLYLAAVGASICLLEVSVSDFVDRKKMDRSKASSRISLIVFLIAIIPALSSTVFSSLTIHDMSLLLLFDSVLVDWLLPIVGGGIAIIVGFGMRKKIKERIFIDDNMPETIQLFKDWNFLLRWLVPGLILAAMILEVFGVFKSSF